MVGGGELFPNPLTGEIQLHQVPEEGLTLHKDVFETKKAPLKQKVAPKRYFDGLYPLTSAIGDPTNGHKTLFNIHVQGTRLNLALRDTFGVVPKVLLLKIL